MPQSPVLMAELWRGDCVESRHYGHAVVAHAGGTLDLVIGDANRLTYGRSAIKMLQALPLVESGAAARAGLTPAHLALACASHSGAPIHTDRVTRWLADLDLTEDALCCGSQIPEDRGAAKALREAGHAPGQVHNVCSGKHAGFLTLARDMGVAPAYIDPDDLVQRTVHQAVEEICQETSPGFGIDGCSAPNYAYTLASIAQAAARMADPSKLGAARGAAAAQIVQAMALHPDLVAGEGRACTELMRAVGDGAAIKTGAEGVFIAILPSRQMGIALKIEDGATRASEAAIAALLVRLGVLDRGHPAAQRRLMAEDRNKRKILTGHTRAAEAMFG